MIHPGLEALKQWDPIEYAAGYRARLAAIPVPENAHTTPGNAAGKMPILRRLN
jgi:hypothetical protein